MPTYGNAGSQINYAMSTTPQARARKAAYALQMNPAYQRQQRAGAYSAQQVGLEHDQQAEQQRREGALSELDKAWGSPERMAGMEKLYSTGLQNQVAGLQHGFQQASQHAGLAAARRGRLGSSFDTEQQAGLQHGLQNDILGAENESYGSLQSLKTADENQRQALRHAIMSGDPQAAAAFQAQAQGYGDQTQQLLEKQRLQEEAQRRQEQQQAANYSTLGNVLTSAGGGFTNYMNYSGGY